MTVARSDLPRPAAVLFDMDGTLVDTEPYWMAAEVELIEAHGGTWTHEDALQVVGMGLWTAAGVFQRHGVTLSADAIVEWMTTRVLEMAEESLPWRPGARELLLELKQAGVPMALVTMSLRRMALVTANAVGFDAFDVVVGGDEVSEPKPSPEPYLLAAARLGVEITECIAIEDSIPGLASAVASGACSIGVPLHAQLAEGPGHTLWPTLAGRGLSDLSELLSTRSERTPA